MVLANGNVYIYYLIANKIVYKTEIASQFYNYISFSKYTEFTRSKLRNVFYEMEFNIKKSTKF